MAEPGTDVTIHMCGCLMPGLMPAAAGIQLVFRSPLTIFSSFLPHA
jgi:hypothetical protein